MEQLPIKSFVSTLFKNQSGGKLELRAIGKKGIKRQFVNPTDYGAIIAFCKTHRNHADVYFTVCPRLQGNGTKEGIVQICAAWLDIDSEKIGLSWPDVQTMLDSVAEKPTMVVASGGGYHVYWRFSKPVGRDAIPTVERLNKALVARFRGDPGATEAARVLRLPSTTNHKYDKPRPVSIRIKTDFEYSFKQLEAVFCNGELTGHQTKANAPLRAREQEDAGTKEHINENYLPKGVTQPGVTSRDENVTKRDMSLTEGHRNETLFSIAHKMARGGATDREVTWVLHLLNLHCKPTALPDRDILTLCQSAIKRRDRAAASFAQMIRDYILTELCDVNVTNVDKDLGIVTTRDKQNRRKCIQRLCEEGLIEPVKNRSGVFRRIKGDFEVVDVTGGLEPVLDLSWPMDLADYVAVPQRAVIVVAGETGAGKTSFLIDMARRNMSRHQIRYLACEGGRNKIIRRLRQFRGTAPEAWPKGSIVISRDDPELGIMPDGVTFVDYLRVDADRLFDVDTKITRFLARLETGVVVVALQKKPGQRGGYGGAFSMFSADILIGLYKNEDRGEGEPSFYAMIEKSRDRARDDVDPYQLERFYNIQAGGPLLPYGERWVRGLKKGEKAQQIGRG
jgi:hypothetical protein